MAACFMATAVMVACRGSGTDPLACLDDDVMVACRGEGAGEDDKGGEEEDEEDDCMLDRFTCLGSVAEDLAKKENKK